MLTSCLIPNIIIANMVTDIIDTFCNHIMFMCDICHSCKNSIVKIKIKRFMIISIRVQKISPPYVYQILQPYI